MVGGVHDPVDEIDVGRRAAREKRLVERVRVTKAPVLDVHVRHGRHEREADARQDRERAVRAVDHAEEQRLLLRRAGDDLARAGHDLVGEAGIVEAAVAERRRLDRAPGDGAAHRDAFQLGDDRRREAVRQRRVHEVPERDPRLGDAAPALRVHLEHVAERGDVDATAREAPVAGGERDDVVDPALVDVRRLARGGERPRLLRDGVHPFVVLVHAARLGGRPKTASWVGFGRGRVALGGSSGRRAAAGEAGAAWRGMPASSTVHAGYRREAPCAPSGPSPPPASPAIPEGKRATAKLTFSAAMGGWPVDLAARAARRMRAGDIA